MKYKHDRFYFLQTGDLPNPMIAFGAWIEGKRDADGPTDIAVDITISGDRTVGFQVEKWLEEDTNSVRFESDTHGEVILSRLDEDLYRKLKETCPFCSYYSFNEMKIGIDGKKV